MTRRLSNIVICLSVLLSFVVESKAQYGDSRFGISASYNISTSSKLFLFPNAKDEILRNQNIDLEGAKSYAIELRYRLTDPLIIGLSVEYLKNTINRTDFTVGGFRIFTEDGFELIPVELNLYYHLPFSTELFKFYMGGGVGLYTGKQIRKFVDVDVSDNGSETAYGIQVSLGMDYIANKYFSIRGEMKFRDPEFDLKSKYNKRVFNFQGRDLLLSRETFETKGNLDGITFSIGVVFRIL